MKPVRVIINGPRSIISAGHSYEQRDVYMYKSGNSFETMNNRVKHKEVKENYDTYCSCFGGYVLDILNLSFLCCFLIISF